MHTHRQPLNKTINSFFSLWNVRSSCSVTGVRRCLWPVYNIKTAVSYSSHGKSCRLKQRCFFLPLVFHLTNWLPSKIVWSMFTPWDLLVFYLGYRLHIIYLHCILNGWVQRAFILCWKDEKDPGWISEYNSHYLPNIYIHGHESFICLDYCTMWQRDMKVGIMTN